MARPSNEFEWSTRRAPLWDELNDLLGESARRRHRMSAERVDLMVLRYQQTAADLALPAHPPPDFASDPRLNEVVARGHASVYRRRRKASWRAVLDFVWTDYPRMVWQIRRYVYVAAAIEIAFTVVRLRCGRCTTRCRPPASCRRRCATPPISTTTPSPPG